MAESAGKGLRLYRCHLVRRNHRATLEPRWRHGTDVLLRPPEKQGHCIFIPDPQFLGYVNPRLGGRGESVTAEYKDTSEYVKLFLPEGEIDFVASLPLNTNPFAAHEVLGRNILLETPVEIVAKKIWYRGDLATPRDLLDLAVVIDHHYDDILANSHVF